MTRSLRQNALKVWFFSHFFNARIVSLSVAVLMRYTYIYITCIFLIQIVRRQDFLLFSPAFVLLLIYSVFLGSILRHVFVEKVQRYAGRLLIKFNVIVCLSVSYVRNSFFFSFFFMAQFYRAFVVFNDFINKRDVTVLEVTFRS